MRFSLTHNFSCSPEEFWEVVTDPEFERRLGEKSDFRRELLEKEEGEDGEFQRVRFVSSRELPGVMKKALGIDRFEFEEKSHRHRAENRLEWTVSTPFLTDRVDASGTTRLEATEEGCKRIIEGTVQVRLPLMGKKMEGKVADNLQEIYEAAAAAVTEMLEER